MTIEVPVEHGTEVRGYHKPIMIAGGVGTVRPQHALKSLAIAPALTADYYGTRFLGEDYGCIVTSVCISGLAGPVLFGLLEDATGSLTHAILPMAILVAFSALLPFAARRPKALSAVVAKA